METGRDGVIVVDVNIVVPLFLDRPTTPIVRRLSEDEGDWRLPSLWRAEFLNILSSYNKFMGIPKIKAQEIWAQVNRLDLIHVEPVDHVWALELSMDKKLSGYDALYAALALKLDCPFVTYDEKLRKALPGVAASPEEYIKTLRK